MHFLLFLTLMTGSCLAHYRGSYDSRNFIVREAPLHKKNGIIIECPVCKKSEQWTDLLDMDDDVCSIDEDGKSYKECKHGTYINEVCGGRLDCYRGPGEKCTVKREFDSYGKKCGPGYYCHKSLGVCTGVEYSIDSDLQLRLNHFPYTWRRSDPKEQFDESKFNF